MADYVLGQLYDAIDVFLDKLKDDECIHAFKQSRKVLEEDEMFQKQIKLFVRQREELADLERIAPHSPAFHKKKIEVLALKRQLDIQDNVYDYKLAENAVQKLLDEVATQLGKSISPHIRIHSGIVWNEKHTCSMLGEDR